MSENREKMSAEFVGVEVKPTEQPLEVPQPSEGGLEGKEFSGLESSEETKNRLEKEGDNLEKVRENLRGEDVEFESVKKIGLPIEKEDKASLELEIKKLKHETKFQAPALLNGNKTATEYDSKVGNFSTQTKIVELPSGRKLFLINNYNTSWVHRGLDSAMKYFTGCKMSKAKSSEWKTQFESKSQIPTIESEDKNLVILDYIPNVNLYDLYANSDEISDWGECDFADNVGQDELMDILDKVVDKIKEIHNQDIAWGELILPNIIIDKEQLIHICDPEVSYDKDVPLVEQKARDLLDMIISASAVMKQKNGKDYSEVVSQITERYENEEVLSELKRLADKKPSIINRIFFGYTKERLGLKNYKEYTGIRDEISGLEKQNIK